MEEHALPYLLAYIHLNPLRAGLVTRVDSPAWTSHRAYAGREQRPDWLQCEYFLRLFGGEAELQKYILALHRGREGWPERMLLTTGWFGGLVEPTSRPAVEEGRSSQVTERQVLEWVCAITGAGLDELRRSVRGPRANPARRFAVWALRHQTRLSHRAIGSLLDMSEVQVANVLRRWDARSSQLRGWTASLDEYVTSDGF